MIAAVAHEQALERKRLHHGRLFGEDEPDTATNRTVGGLLSEEAGASARADAFGGCPCGGGFPAAVNTLEGDEDAAGHTERPRRSSG